MADLSHLSDEELMAQLQKGSTQDSSSVSSLSNEELMTQLGKTPQQPSFAGDIPAILAHTANGVAGGIPEMALQNPLHMLTGGLPSVIQAGSQQGAAALLKLIGMNKTADMMTPQGPMADAEKQMNLGQFMPQAQSAGGKIAQTVGEIGGGLVGGPGKTAVENAPREIKAMMDLESTFQKTKQTQQALDTVRNALGRAKELAVQPIEHLPTDFQPKQIKTDFLKDLMNTEAIGIAKNADGSLNTQVGNMDKLKTAIDQGMQMPAFKSLHPQEQAHIMDVRSDINETIKYAAKKAGVNLDAPLNAYHEFMQNYPLLKGKITAEHGIAATDQMKAIFRDGAQNAYKEAWQNLNKFSPELKNLMGTMESRMKLQNLLRPAGRVAKGAAITGAGLAGIPLLGKLLRH